MDIQVFQVIFISNPGSVHWRLLLEKAQVQHYITKALLSCSLWKAGEIPRTELALHKGDLATLSYTEW